MSTAMYFNLSDDGDDKLIPFFEIPIVSLEQVEDDSDETQTISGLFGQ